MSQHLHRQYLQAMGIDVWEARQTEQRLAETEVVADAMPDPSVPSPSQPAPSEPPDPEQAPSVHLATQTDEPAPTPIIDDAGFHKLNWEGLKLSVSTCQRCELYQTRTQTVFGVGDPKADLLIIGEAPGADEDKQGEPFVGRAGQLLNAMLQAIQLTRPETYIANILKCRPPNNRDPKPEEASLCSDYLNRQIELIQPKLILALGRIAAQKLLKVDTSLAKLRGQFHTYGPTNTPLMVTYHPAYLLRSPAEKAKAWQDLVTVKHHLTVGD